MLAAGSGAEALSVLETHHGPLHLLLSDVVMPGMSGPELAALVGERPADPGLRADYANLLMDNKMYDQARRVLSGP